MFTINKLDIDHPSLAFKGKIIKSNIVIAQRTAETILSKASDEADAIIKSAQSLYQSELQKAFNEGHKTWEAEKAKLTAEFNLEIANQTQLIKNWLAEQIVQLTNKLIGQTPDKEALKGLVEQSIAQLSKDCTLSLKVSPENSGIAKLATEEIMDNHQDIESFEVIVDPALKTTDCLLIHPEGTHDISIETQLNNTRSLLESSID